MITREERRDHLLDVALEVVLRYGYRKANLGDVAREAGFSRATVYNYFPNKEALLSAVVAREIERINMAVSERLDLTASPDRQLLSYVCVRRQLLERIKSFYILAHNVTRDVMHIVQREIDEHQERERAFLEGLIRQGVNQGMFRKIDPVLMGAALFSAIRGLDEDYVFDSKEDFAQGAEYLIRALLVGLLRDPGEITIDVCPQECP